MLLFYPVCGTGIFVGTVATVPFLFSTTRGATQPTFAAKINAFRGTFNLLSYADGVQEASTAKPLVNHPPFKGEGMQGHPIPP